MNKYMDLLNLLLTLLILGALIYTRPAKATNLEHFGSAFIATAVMQGFYQKPLSMPKPMARIFALVAGSAVATAAGVLDRQNKQAERIGYGLAGVAVWTGLSITFDF